MEAWWGSLETSLKVFYAIGIGSAAVLAIQAVMMLFGMDGDDGDLDSGDASILSIRTITAFLVGFGWTGVAAIQAGLSVALASVAGLFVGGALMTAVFLMMRVLYGMTSEGTLDYRNAIGGTGKVYLPIPAAMERPGQIEILVQGRLRVVEAMTKEGEPIPRHAQVRVVDVVDPTTLLVEPS